MRAFEIKAVAANTPARKHTAEVKRSTVSPPHITAFDGALLQRKPGCACGGGCPRCQDQNSVQPKLKINTPGDQYEQEADRVADQVMQMPGPRNHATTGLTKQSDSIVQRKCGQCDEDEKLIQKKGPAGATNKPRNAPPTVHETLRSPGQRLDATTRAFMEPRFGHDFSQVRVHADARAANSAQGIGALAFTVGQDIVFGLGQFAPETTSGRRLLAHELAHVVQQTTTPGSGRLQRAPEGVVQRAPTVSILDENFIGPPSPSQRRAERSCPIDCCSQPRGTLHAMALFEHASRGAIVAAGSAAATGIGVSLHFIAGGTNPPVGDRCHCDNFHIVQVLETTHPDPTRGGNSYVDNGGKHTAYYQDLGRHGQGRHAIPAGYPDAGQRVRTTESIYDRPFRDTSALGTTSLSWMAESCVACLRKNQPDRILGCVTYGFTRNYNATTSSFDPVVPVSPGCLYRPSKHFVDTLRSDPTTTSYSFQPAPPYDDCNIGDFPPPRGDTRVA